MIVWAAMVAMSAMAAEPALLQRAREARIHTEETQAAADHRAAAAAYEVWLEASSPSEGHEVRWFLADTLFRAKATDRAAAEYERLVATEAEHSYGDGAALRLPSLWRAVVQERFGGVEALPAGAEVERTYEGRRDAGEFPS